MWSKFLVWVYSIFRDAIIITEDVSASSQALTLGSGFHAVGTVMAAMRQAMGIRTKYILKSIDVHFMQAGHALFSGWEKTEGRTR
jgi:hypothetical protein